MDYVFSLEQDYQDLDKDIEYIHNQESNEVLSVIGIAALVVVALGIIGWIISKLTDKSSSGSGKSSSDYNAEAKKKVDDLIAKKQDEALKEHREFMKRQLEREQKKAEQLAQEAAEDLKVNVEINSLLVKYSDYDDVIDKKFIDEYRGTPGYNDGVEIFKSKIGWLDKYRDQDSINIFYDYLKRENASVEQYLKKRKEATDKKAEEELQKKMKEEREHLEKERQEAAIAERKRKVDALFHNEANAKANILNHLKVNNIRKLVGKSNVGYVVDHGAHDILGILSMQLTQTKVTLTNYVKCLGNFEYAIESVNSTLNRDIRKFEDGGNYKEDDVKSNHSLSSAHLSPKGIFDQGISSAIGGLYGMVGGLYLVYNEENDQVRMSDDKPTTNDNRFKDYDPDLQLPIADRYNMLVNMIQFNSYKDLADDFKEVVDYISGFNDTVDEILDKIKNSMGDMKKASEALEQHYARFKNIIHEDPDEQYTANEYAEKIKKDVEGKIKAVTAISRFLVAEGLLRIKVNCEIVIQEYPILLELFTKYVEAYEKRSRYENYGTLDD